MDHGSGTTSDANIPRSEHVERDDRGVGQIPQLLRPSVAAGRLDARVLGDRARDGVVQAAIQYAEVIRADGRRQFHGQLGNGLTNVAIAVHDLSNGEPPQEQVTPVPDRALNQLVGV
jgi:hypothetical protein